MIQNTLEVSFLELLVLSRCCCHLVHSGHLHFRWYLFSLNLVKSSQERALEEPFLEEKDQHDTYVVKRLVETTDLLKATKDGLCNPAIDHRLLIHSDRHGRHDLTRCSDWRLRKCANFNLINVIDHRNVLLPIVENMIQHLTLSLLHENLCILAAAQIEIERLL